MPEPLRPLSLGELLDRSFGVYRQNFGLLAGIAAIPYFFVLLLQIWMRSAGFVPPLQVNLANIGSYLVYAGVMALVGFLALAFASSGVVNAVASVYLGNPTSVGTAMKQGLPRVPAMFLMTVVLEILVGIGMILLIVPGIWLISATFVIYPVLVLEPVGPLGALQRTFRLTQGSRMRALGALLLFGVIFMVGGLLVDMIAGGLGVLISGPTNYLGLFTLLVQFGGFLLDATLMPLLIVGLVLFYFDLRIRKEAFDIQLLMQRAEAPPLPAPGQA